MYVVSGTGHVYFAAVKQWHLQSEGVAAHSSPHEVQPRLCIHVYIISNIKCRAEGKLRGRCSKQLCMQFSVIAKGTEQTKLLETQDSW